MGSELVLSLFNIRSLDLNPLEPIDFQKMADVSINSSFLGAQESSSSDNRPLGCLWTDRPQYPCCRHQ